MKIYSKYLIMIFFFKSSLTQFDIPGLGGNENGFAIKKEKGGYLNLKLGKEGAPIYIDQSPSYIYKDPPTEYNQNGIRLPLSAPHIITTNADSSENTYNNERMITSNFYTPMSKHYDSYSNERKLLIDQNPKKKNKGRKLIQNRKIFGNQIPNRIPNQMMFQNYQNFQNSNKNFKKNKIGRNLFMNKELSHMETIANRRGPLNDRGIALQAPLKRSEVDKNFEVTGRGEYNHYLSDKDLFEQTNVMLKNVQDELTNLNAIMGTKDIEVEKLIERLFNDKFS